MREAARKYTTRALTTLAKLLADPDPKVRAIAARELLDRAHGKPMAPTEITGRDGEPLHPPAGDMTDIEIARLIAFTLTQGDRQASKLAEAAAAQRAASGQASVKEEPKTQVALAGQPGSTVPPEPTAADRAATDEMLERERRRNEALREELRRPDQADHKDDPPQIIRFPRRDR